MMSTVKKLRWLRRLRSSRDGAELLLAVGAIGATFCVAGLMVSLMGQPVADFPAWWEATSTAAAFAAATLAAVYAATTFERERSRDEERELQRRQEQASLVAAWVGELAPHSSSTGPVPIATGGVSAVRVQLRNASALPVENVEIRVELTEILASGATMSQDLPLHILDVLPPDDRPLAYVVPVPARHGAGMKVRAQTVDWSARVDLSFLDATGIGWTRKAGHPLAESSSNSG